MFSALVLALTALRIQLASAQSTLDATHTTFSDGSVGDPSTSGVVALKGTPITQLPAAVATFTSCYIVSTQATTTTTATVSFECVPFLIESSAQTHLNILQFNPIYFNI